MKLKMLVGSLAAFASLHATADTIYSNNFETNAAGFSGAGVLASSEGYSAFGFGAQYLYNDSPGNPAPASVLTLTLAGAVTGVTMTFDLAVIDSWDPYGPSSPDTFSRSFTGPGTGTSTNILAFDNSTVHTTIPGYLTPLSFGTNLAVTSGFNDSAYRIRWDLGSLAAGTYTMSFFAGSTTGGSPWVGGTNESWAIDNVNVTGTLITPVPEPETYAMLLAGLGLLGFAARRRKQKEATTV